MTVFSFRATSKAKKSVEKVRAQEWAEPPGQAFAVSAAIAEAFEGFLPGAKSYLAPCRSELPFLTPSHPGKIKQQSLGRSSKR